MKTDEQFYEELKYWFTSDMDHSETKEIIVLIIEQIKLQGQQIGSDNAFKVIKTALK